jgi:spermidine synthase
VRSATVVDSDGRLMRIARTDPGLALLNRHSFLDPRVHAVPADPFDWLRDRRGPYDVVLVDLPDPCLSRSAKLYSQEFFGLAARALAPGGRLAVHAPGDLWTLDATLRAAGLHTLPYAPGGPPTPGGLDLAAATPPHLHLPGVTFRPLRAPERDFPPSTLMRPRL